MTCNHCGRDMPDDAPWCFECGRAPESFALGYEHGRKQPTRRVFRYYTSESGRAAIVEKLMKYQAACEMESRHQQRDRLGAAYLAAASKEVRAAEEALWEKLGIALQQKRR